MPFLRPNLTTLRSNIYSDVISETGQPALRGSILSALTWAWANCLNGLYAYLDWISLQSVPFTATDVYLQAWGSLVGINREVASTASGQTTITWTAAASLPAASALARSDGTTYQTTTAVAGTTGAQSVPIIATAPGAIGNCEFGTPLMLVSPVIGINSSTSSGIITGGADNELDPALRTRVLQRFAQPPQGGSISDYEEWAALSPGVTRVWVNPNGMGNGTVVVYIMEDVVDAAFGGFPQGTNGTATNEPRAPSATGDQLICANLILPLEPVTALVYVVAPIPQPIAVRILSLMPSTAPVQAAIQANLTQLFLQLGSPLPSTIYLSQINAAIESATGVVSYNLVTPSANIVSTMGNLPILGALTWV